MNSIHPSAENGFTVGTAAYERGRPGYPAQVGDFLVESLGLTPRSCVLDLGAGTGKFTRILVDRKLTVTAAEPVRAMRDAFIKVFTGIPLVNATAESLPFPEQSFDLVTAAQAFHWFQGDKALKEIHRVLSRKGHLVLIWNRREESADWVRKLGEIMTPYEGSTPRHHSGEWKRAFEDSSLFALETEKSFLHSQEGTPSLFVDRVLSVSFIAALPEEERKTISRAVLTLLASHPDTKGKATISLPYETELFIYAKKTRRALPLRALTSECR